MVSWNCSFQIKESTKRLYSFTETIFRVHIKYLGSSTNFNVYLAPRCCSREHFNFKFSYPHVIEFTTLWKCQSFPFLASYAHLEAYKISFPCFFIFFEYLFFQIYNELLGCYPSAYVIDYNVANLQAIKFKPTSAVVK